MKEKRLNKMIRGSLHCCHGGLRYFQLVVALPCIMEIELFHDKSGLLQASQSIADGTRCKTGFVHNVLMGKGLSSFEQLKDAGAGIRENCSLHNTTLTCMVIKISKLVLMYSNKMPNSMCCVRYVRNNMLFQSGGSAC
jgi:hypothetical protein